MSRTHIVGHSAIRVDGLAKVTGAAQYVDDLEFGPGLLHAAVVESPHAHAEILKIDTRAAEKAPGVVRVVTGADFPYTFGLYMSDRYIFAMDRVRFVGEQIAAVIAETPEEALRAAKLVKVAYRPLPPVLSLAEALKKDAVLLHPKLGEYQRVPWFYPKAGTNIAHWRKTRKGDPAEGFKQADYILEDTYTVPRYAHCPIEPHATTAFFDMSGRLTLWASSQSPFAQRDVMAIALKPFGLTHRDIRVVTPYVGGGFGGKAGVSMEIIAAVLAIAMKGRPVRLHWTREQEFRNTSQRQGVIARIKMGVRKTGEITALEHTLHWDAGASAEYGANVVNAVGLSATGPYRIPHVKIDSVCVYTNMPPCGAYRGFGYSEFHFGLESHLNRIAKAIGMDPVELRRRNAIREGDTLAYGAAMNPGNLLGAMDAVAGEIQWGRKKKSKKSHKVIGKGMACFWKAPALPPNASSSAYLKFNEDGSMNLSVSGMEIGQGFLTVMAQVAAEVLTVPVAKIRVETPDTDRNAYEWQTVGSHVTWGCGNAVRAAAEDVKKKLIATAARGTKRKAADLYLQDECVKSRKDASFSLPFRDYVISGIMQPDGRFIGGPIHGTGMFMPEFTTTQGDPETSQGGHPNVHYTVGCAGVIVEFDKETGKMDILKVALAVDAGKAINPQLVRGQIVGGIVQGLATALYEDIRYAPDGRLLNPNFTDYKIPTALDCPAEIVPIILETPQPDGPFGARGIGEHTMIASAPMMANAIEDALGVRLKTMPLTAEKIALALKGIDYEEVKGDSLGFCFRGRPCDYPFEVGGGIS
ncbi:MAG: xanthine dehydrogenase family protein molybdopterin-binding subunit [Verrucomicrobiota bacterium]|jgi:carbon-monoxide dehydrogenase large subunit|nr:xanthine dehydrogenase family protein molybdopterin-binding subunit [Verrucomicrobiota bacterium]